MPSPLLNWDRDHALSESPKSNNVSIFAFWMRPPPQHKLSQTNLKYITSVLIKSANRTQKCQFRILSGSIAWWSFGIGGVSPLARCAPTLKDLESFISNRTWVGLLAQVDLLGSLEACSSPRTRSCQNTLQPPLEIFNSKTNGNESESDIQRDIKINLS